jgi:hypothetical protein
MHLLKALTAYRRCGRGFKFWEKPHEADFSMLRRACIDDRWRGFGPR